MVAEMIVADNVVATVVEIVAETAEAIVLDKVAVAVAEQIWYPFMHLKPNNKVLLCARGGCYD